MYVPKNTEEVKQRLAWIEEQLQKINGAIATELEQPLSKRRACLCGFLDKEKNEFSARLEELNWLTNE
jgi:tetrahydromethanopterin S-methyltransferase subunit G